MEFLYNNHRLLVENISVPVRRRLLDEISVNDRLTAIKGYRGVGKTSFLLSYAKEHFRPTDRQCLYINLNNFYFTTRSIRDFASEFRLKGGKLLLIDQTFKYPAWWEDLLYCYENLPDLRIIFSASSVIDFDNPAYRFADKVTIRHLRGFSFREYLELTTGFRFPAVSLSEILENHQQIAADICSKIKPLAYIADYLHHGFYPFFLEKRNFAENLLKTANMMLEVDLLSVNQMEKTYLPKIRLLLYLISTQNTHALNISKLSAEVNISRATVMNYIRYLNDARLINLLYSADEKSAKKPSKVYVHNPNLLQVMRPSENIDQLLRETFFCNQIFPDYVYCGGREAQFITCGNRLFNVGDRIRGKFNPEIYYAISGIESGERRVIPLWLFGFMY
jgi:predicted AAA+ superfamily ATPase